MPKKPIKTVEPLDVSTAEVTKSKSTMKITPISSATQTTPKETILVQERWIDKTTNKILVIFLILAAVFGYFAYTISQQPCNKFAKPFLTNLGNSISIKDCMENNKVTLTNGLILEDLVVGTGAEVKSGDTVNMHYLGTLENGVKFDSSYDRKETFPVKIGVGQVIPGWDLGIPGMKIGGKRKLTIPAALAYGDRGAGGVIPPNATLIFEVEAVSK
jgi:FKBP-type peptidyl-prolyl cis-trans isomerase FkpA